MIQRTSAASDVYYELTNEEWLQATQDLKHAEIKVLYYLRTMEPLGDRSLPFKVSDLADTLGLAKGTVSRALKILNHKGYIDLESTERTIRLQLKY